jgi:hypothetical protein
MTKEDAEAIMEYLVEGDYLMEVLEGDYDWVPTGYKLPSERLAIRMLLQELIQAIDAMGV